MEFGGTTPTREGPFTRDIVIINISAVILWTLTLEPTLQSIINNLSIKTRKRAEDFGKQKA